MMLASMAHMMGDQERKKRQGLLDTLGASAAAGFGLRLMRGAYTGNCCNIRRSSDNAQADIGFDSQGNFNVGAFSAFIGGGNGFVTKWYDQSGNGNDASQSTAANQPQLSLAITPNGRPSLVGNGSRFVQTTATFTAAQPFTLVATADAGSVGLQNCIELGTTIALNASTTNFGLFAGSQLSQAASNVFHVGIAVANNTSSTINVDGTTTSGTAGGNTPSSSALSLLGATSSLTGDMVTGLFFLPSLTAAQQAAIVSSERTYYGF